MAEHLSVESFMGGVLLGAMVAGLVVGLVAYWKWGRESDARKVQLLAAQANEAATLIAAAQEREQDRAEYERGLAATQAVAAQNREQDRAKYEKELAATRTAAAQDRADYENELSTARRGLFDHIASTLRSIASQTVAWLGRWTKRSQPSTPAD